MTGASGVIGRRAVPLLVRSGHAVTAIGRSAVKQEMLARLGATPLDVDLFAVDDVRRAMDGHEAVINLATHIPPSTMRLFLPTAWRENDRIRSIASNVLVDAAIDVGAKRFIQESFAPIYADQGDAWIDERAAVRPVRYNRSVLDAEGAAARFRAAGGAAIVLRFAFFYGPDAYQTADMIAIVRKGWSPIPGPPNAFSSSISHDDAATAVAAALALPAGTYNVSDDEPVRRRDFVNSLATTLGVSPPKFLPTWVTALTGSLGRLMARSERISNGALRQASSWHPRYRSVREGWGPTIDALRESLADRRDAVRTARRAESRVSTPGQ